MRKSGFGHLLVFSFLLLAYGCSHETPTNVEPDQSVVSPPVASQVMTLEDLADKMAPRAATSQADVAITEFTGPTAVSPGDTLALHATVTNIGREIAEGPFDVWIGVLDTGFEFGRVTLTSLEAGGARSGGVNFHVPAAKFAKVYPPGIYTLYCTHDFGDANPTNDYQLLDVELVNGLDDGFVLISAGTFTMGSPLDEPGRFSNETQHQVTLTRDFYMSPFEVTEELWDAVMGTGISTSQKPQINVSWYEAVEFCNTLSMQKGLTPAYEGSGTTWTWNQGANGYRLPTEAEWEYGCRAGSATAFANGGITELGCDLDPNLNAMGWYCYNADHQNHDVGQKQANSWGLYDMHGNDWEWCWDWYDSYPGAVTDPTGPSSGLNRVLRGGSWSNGAQFSRSAYRYYHVPATGSNYGGFRLARSAN